MLALAWPLMLANLTMQLIQATDVVLLGWLGPNGARRGRAGAQPFVRDDPVRIGSPHRFVADDRLGARRPLQRRSRRPADFPPVAMGGGVDDRPDADRPVERRADHPRLRAGSGARSARRLVPARLHVGDPALDAVPGHAQLRVRDGATRLGAGDQHFGHTAQRDRQLVADLRPLRPSGARADRRRHRQLDRLGGDGVGAGRRDPDRPPVPPLPSVRTVLAARLAALPPIVPPRRPDRPDDGLRRRRVQRRRLSHGPVRRALGRGAPDRAADRGDDLHDPARPRPGGDRPRRPRLRPPRPRRDRAGRLDGVRPQHRLHDPDGGA